MVTAALLLSACATPLAFKPGNAMLERFQSDRAACHLLASNSVSLAESQAERYDSGSSAQMAGAGIAAMFFGGRQSRRVYNNCMKMRGYRP